MSRRRWCPREPSARSPTGPNGASRTPRGETDPPAEGPNVLTRRNTGNDHDCFCARPTAIPMLNPRRNATERKEVVEMRVLKVGDGTMIQPQPEVAASADAPLAEVPSDVAAAHPLVLVRWQDAWFDADQQDDEDWRNDYLVQTVGFVVRQEPDLVSVAQELLPEGDGYRAVTHIPRGMIVSMMPLTNLRRSERRVDAGTASAVVGSSHLEQAVGA